MASRSGKYGKVMWDGSGHAYANKWEMDEKVDAEQYGIFGGGGYKLGNVGQKSASGNVTGVYDFSIPIENALAIGDDVTLLLYLSTAAGGGAKYFSVPAQITGLKISVDGESGAKTGWSFTWQSNGAWTDPT